MHCWYAYNLVTVVAALYVLLCCSIALDHVDCEGWCATQTIVDFFQIAWRLLWRLEVHAAALN